MEEMQKTGIKERGGGIEGINKKIKLKKNKKKQMRQRKKRKI